MSRRWASHNMASEPPYSPVKSPHRPDHSTEHSHLLIQREAVIDASRERDHVPLFHGNPDPLVLLVPDIEVPAALQDVADLLVQVQMLLEEHLDLTQEGSCHAAPALTARQQ